MGRLRPKNPSHHVAGYLATSEEVVLEIKQHWARVIPAASACVIGFALVLIAGFAAPAWMGVLTNASWWIWLVLVIHLGWRIIEWRDETFVVTNKRIILVHGIAVKKVAMMPLSKVTDMSYNRSIGARILGYGTFVMESAGHEQALSNIAYVPEPDRMYRELCGLIFGVEDDEEAGAPHHHPNHHPHHAAAGHRGQDTGFYPDEYVYDYDDWHNDEHRGDIHPVDETDPYGIEIPGSAQDDDERGAWSVSHEHATKPQAVRRRTERSSYADPEYPDDDWWQRPR